MASHGPGSTSHEHGTRRNQTNGAAGQIAGSSAAEASRAYRNSHAYVVSQQPLFTSWNLPDYLAHLEEMLPTDTPRPLEVRSGPGVGGPGGITGMGRGESMECTMERGVKVKWPSKRMSVGDMNKRVRALVEWVGREQASALDRDRRREALEKSLREENQSVPEQQEPLRNGRGDEYKDPAQERAMVLDDQGITESPVQGRTLTDAMDQDQEMHPPSSMAMLGRDEGIFKTSATMKLMEELMEELIGFQERFGPGAKSRERERRLAAAAAS